MSSIRLYGCGGAGVNLASDYFGREPGANMAEILPSLVDTSESNLRQRHVPEESTYLVDGLDGSGKIRSENHKEISRVVKNVLIQQEPAEFNVVIFSASGGSGSVIGPLIIRELIDRQLPVVAMVIGSDESVIAAQNTLKTLQSLESIAQNGGTPVVMSYHQNSNAEKRSATDAELRSVITCLAVLASGRNQEMDYRDLVHWLHYTKVNGGAAQLATLSVATNEKEFTHLEAPISVASIYSSPDQPHVSTGADYHSVGYADLSELHEIDEMHFAIDLNRLDRIGKEIKARAAKMEEEKRARVQPDSLLHGVSDQSTEDDIIL